MQRWFQLSPVSLVDLLLKDSCGLLFVTVHLLKNTSVWQNNRSQWKLPWQYFILFILLSPSSHCQAPFLGARALLPWGPHKEIFRPDLPDSLPRQMPLCLLLCRLNTSTKAKLSGKGLWGSFACLWSGCWWTVNGRSHQPHSQPRAQPAITPLHRAPASAHLDWRARARRKGFSHCA